MVFLRSQFMDDRQVHVIRHSSHTQLLLGSAYIKLIKIFLLCITHNADAFSLCFGIFLEYILTYLLESLMSPPTTEFDAEITKYFLSYYLPSNLFDIISTKEF